uniref:Hypothetical conserved protein n=1 Tax=Glossina morsitans morsitans TaxID=37546 RepID=D3TRC6_GLOMM
MRTKHFIVILCCVIITTILFIALGPASETNDSLKNIVSQTHQQFNKLQENLRVSERKKLEIDAKYLTILGFPSQINYPKTAGSEFYKYEVNEGITESLKFKNNKIESPKNDYKKTVELTHKPLQHETIAQTNLTSAQLFNDSKANFSIVTYVQEGQSPLAILMLQNIASKLPNEFLLIYDLGLSEEDARALNAYCNSTRCSVISYDLSVFPTYVADQRMHAYRPIVIKDALMRSKYILFAENYMRIRGSAHDFRYLQNKVAQSGVLGWNTPIAVSARTHPKMFDYFQTDIDDFFFLRMVDMDTVFFADNFFVTEKIMLPWIKCALTLECIDPIGAQSNGCKYNKKPQYRYSGCHSYDASAFNIVLGLTWFLDDTKYSLPSDSYNIFYKETLEQATKILENRRRNSSEISEHPITED